MTVDELISKGDYRKIYHEMVKNKEVSTLYSKPDIKDIAGYRMHDRGIPYQDTVKILNMENQKMKAEIEEFCRGVMQITVDSLNRTEKCDG